MAVERVAGAPPSAWPQKAVALGQLAKVRLFQIWLGPFVAWSLLPHELAWRDKSVALVLLFFVVVMTGMWATHALDDISGYRDGTDAVTYAPERGRSQKKPLVLGTLTEREAVRFAVVSAALAISAVIAFGAVAAFRPRWLVLVALAAVLAGIQYSAGVRFSYRFPGGGESLTVLTLATTVFLPYSAATGRFTLLVAAQSAAFGIWLVLVLICSNAADAEADRAAGRHTVAASTSETGNRRFIAGVFAAGVAAVAVPVAMGRLTPWALAAVFPAWALQAYVVANAWNGRYRLRRNFGFDAVRLGVLGLVVANVVR